MSLTKKISLILFIIFFIITSPFLLLSIPSSELNKYIFKNVFYLNVSQNILKNLQEPDSQKIIISLSRYTSSLLSLKDGQKHKHISSAGPIDFMVYGGAWCSGQASVFLTLFSKISNQKSRIIDVQHHTCAEVLLNDRWVLVDPYFRFISFDQYGRLSTLEEIQKPSPSLNISQNSDIGLKRGKEIYILNPIRWEGGRSPIYSEMIESKGIVRKLLNSIIKLSVGFYGRFWSDLVINSYLKNIRDPEEITKNNWNDKICPKGNKMDFVNFYRSRVLLLYGRTKLSEKYYQKIDKSSFWKKRYKSILTKHIS